MPQLTPDNCSCLRLCKSNFAVTSQSYTNGFVCTPSVYFTQRPEQKYSSGEWILVEKVLADALKPYRENYLGQKIPHGGDAPSMVHDNIW